ncbi:uncharacterized protein LOC126707472 [Quercus robur]|uniref:uncharacterized protein LOC126707472 n=1 Tax=Quercus robur TaxID=38942 RepID=UPI002162C5A9|nr:uncharacterized protein LOC126707472 [Quercus robur]
MDSLCAFSKVDYYPKIAEEIVIEAFRSVEPNPYPSLPPECLEDPPHPESMTFKYFLNHLPTDSEKIFWEFNPSSNEVLQFGPYFRRLFGEVAKLLYGHFEMGFFSGDLLNRLRIRRENLMVYHPFKMSKDCEDNLGRTRDLVHYRYMMASVVKKCLKPHDISKYFTLGFSELFLQRPVVKKFYMFQLFHPIIYNDWDKYKLIHALVDMRIQDKTHFYKSFGFQVQKYGYSNWWRKVENETPESMLGHVYSFEGRPFKNASDLPVYLRHLHSHYHGAILAINNAKKAAFNQEKDNIYDHNTAIEAEMAKFEDGDPRKETLGAEIRVQSEKPKLESLPLHSELEPIITERFPGVYSCMVDAIIRAFAVDANAEIPFRCSISELLFLKGPFGDNYAYKSIYFQDVSEKELKRPITKESSTEKG